MNVSKAALAVLLAADLAACNPFSPDPKGWYVKSAKGDTVVLYHEHKTFKVKCKGTLFRGNDKLFASCFYLALNVGKTKEDGTGVGQIKYLGNVTFYIDMHGEEGTHEIYEVIEETAQ
jgi:hypothetical protein